MRDQNTTCAVSLLHLEAALCVWEWMLDARHTGALPAPYESVWSRFGSVHMRLVVSRAVADYALLLFDEPQVRDRIEGLHAYDWDYIPSVCLMIRRFTDDGRPVLPSLARGIEFIEDEYGE
jgi:hypothetical protein